MQQVVQNCTTPPKIGLMDFTYFLCNSREYYYKDSMRYFSNCLYLKHSSVLQTTSLKLHVYENTSSWCWLVSRPPILRLSHFQHFLVRDTMKIMKSWIYSKRGVRLRMTRYFARCHVVISLYINFCVIWNLNFTDISIWIFNLCANIEMLSII